MSILPKKRGRLVRVKPGAPGVIDTVYPGLRKLAYVEVVAEIDDSIYLGTVLGLEYRDHRIAWLYESDTVDVR